MPVEENPGGLVARGDKRGSFPGTLTFVGLRLADPFLQYSLLSGGGARFVNWLGLSVISPGVSFATGIDFLDSLDLSAYRLAILGMCVGSAAKMVVWKALIGEETMRIGAASIIAGSNSLMNCLNTLAFIAAVTSPAATGGQGPGEPGWPSVPLAVGLPLFGIGIMTELISEFQRKEFKKQHENWGKPFTGGLFGLARHINYGAYVLWRAGLALASGGWIFGAAATVFFGRMMLTNSVPELDSYCQLRYGDMWSDYKKKTPYKLWPYII